MTEFRRLPAEAYTQQEWLDQEWATLFTKAWYVIGTTSDFADVGDYRTLRVGRAPLAVLKDREGELFGFHNLCRHRGLELLDEGAGNVGKAIVCPYHRWTYGLDGSLRGVANKPTCFPDLDRSTLNLKPAAVGVFKDLVFINPDPSADFEEWIGPVRGQEWPHDLHAKDMKEAVALEYDMKCNWKVFAENGIDGYHLVHLHEHTLGGPSPDQNVWERAGDHMIWYATEEGIRHRLPAKIRNEAGNIGKIKSAATPGYGGVYFLFPATLIVPTPFGMSISQLHPVSPGRTRLTSRRWVGPWQTKDDRRYIPGFNKATGVISSDHWTQHPLETGDFQTEDVWVCEKVQRGLESFAYEHGPLSQGPGAEDPLRWFHESVFKAMESAG